MRRAVHRFRRSACRRRRCRASRLCIVVVAVPADAADAVLSS
jgi:hypothetical protein